MSMLLVMGYPAELNDDGKIQLITGTPFPKLDGYEPTTIIGNERSWIFIG